MFASHFEAHMLVERSSIKSMQFSVQTEEFFICSSICLSASPHGCPSDGDLLGQLRGNKNLPNIIKGDQPCVKQRVEIRSQQQSVEVI